MAEPVTHAIVRTSTAPDQRAGLWITVEVKVPDGYRLPTTADRPVDLPVKTSVVVEYDGDILRLMVLCPRLGLPNPT